MPQPPYTDATWPRLASGRKRHLGANFKYPGDNGYDPVWDLVECPLVGCGGFHFARLRTYRAHAATAERLARRQQKETR